MTNIDTQSALEHVHSDRCWWNPDQARWVCPGTGGPHDAATTRDTDRPLVDVRDMIVVHTAMLREFRLLPTAVAETQVGDRKRVQAVADHLRFLCDLLHHHHEGEDELLWPKLRQRTLPAALEVIEEVESQHLEIDLALSGVEEQRQAWAGDPSPDHRDHLVARLGRLHTVLREHLDLEERALLPLAASVLTPAEWEAIGEEAVAAMPKSVLPLVFGMFAYEGDPEVLRDMLKAAPLVPRTLLPLIAPRVYARRARQVYGTARP